LRLGTFYVSARGKPRVVTRVSKVRMTSRNKKRTFLIETELLGQRDVPVPYFPNIRGRVFGRKDFARRKPTPEVHGHRPSFLELHFVPKNLAKPRRRPVRVRNAKGQRLEPMLIFAPDRRYTFFDTSYPWCTTGRVDAGLTGAGVLVGPRHLLTASHLMNWNDDGTALSPRFRPLYYNGYAPFGSAWGFHWYAYRKVGHSIGWWTGDTDVSEDYVVWVLDQRLGDRLGWMGSKVYSQDWDDHPYWSQVGYGLTSGNKPSFQDQISVEDADNPGFMDWGGPGLDIETETASITPGDSGGPFFGWWNWNSGVWPFVVGVTSAGGWIEVDNDNWAGGGPPLVQLIKKARSDYP
jgi:hypothetical protein